VMHYPSHLRGPRSEQELDGSEHVRDTGSTEGTVLAPVIGGGRQLQ
jgi:hypothetical protein